MITKKPSPREVLYFKDIMLLTEQSESSARRLMYKIKRHFKRKFNTFISIDDFCSFTGINADRVREML